MLVKYFMAAAIVAAGVFAIEAPVAQAKNVDVDINLGIGGGYPGYPVYPGYPAYAPDRLSCWQGAKRVSWAGFWNVKPVDCTGRFYTYRARRGPGLFFVTVNSRSGRIVN